MAPKLPYYMVSQPALFGLVEPGRGRAKLRYFADVSDALGEGSLQFELRTARPPNSSVGARSWTATGVQPFAWDLMPPVGERKYPVIRLVIDRDVLVTMTAKPGANRNAPPLGTPFLGPRAPFVEIFRPQDPALIPQPGEPIEIDRVLGSPYVVQPGWMTGGLREIERGFNGFLTVNVTPTPNGVRFQSAYFGFQVELAIDQSFKGGILGPGAFTYEITAPQATSDPHWITLKIVHTGNVRISGRAMENLGFIVVETAAVLYIEDIPPQGSSLEDFPGLKPFNLQIIKKPKSKSETRAIFLFELAIGFIPFIGPLYFVAQFAYACATGEDFWGREVHGADYLLLGVGALLPLALPSRSVGALRTQLAKSPLARVLDEGVTLRMRDIANRELLEAVGSIDVQSATALARHLTLYASGKLGAEEVLRRFNDIIGRAYVRWLDRKSIEAVMTTSFDSFKNRALADGFAKFASKARKAGKKADPIDWAIRQTGRSRHVAALESELGTDWRAILKRSRNDVRVNPLPATAITHYDKLAGRVVDYKSLSKQNKGFGELFEVDHILEQRFWRNDPRVVTSFDEVGEGMTMLVPLNPAIAAKMPGPGTIAYVHTTKTKMLADLIPNGREAEFTVQQIWDAHIFTLEALNVDRSVTFGERLIRDFQTLARARREPLNLRLPTDVVFGPNGRWPVLPGTTR